jgi:chaperone BCS1
MVYQNKHFLVDDCIYAKAELEEESDKDDKGKSTVRTDKITLYIYSYKYSMSELMQYIDDITEKYLMSIKTNRSNKRFIYSLDKVDLKEEDSPLDCWREDIFESARTFNNIFFDGKKQLIDKITFFLNNKDWYYQKGIPYSLGIGLHGPPGTGKTSFIKAIANYTNRHIIVISLKLIKTKSQLEKLFFENTYNYDNENNYISWDKKILVFEDIDCIGDIILNREEKEKENKKKNKNNSKKTNKTNDNIKVGDIIQTICEINDSSNMISSSSKETLITLDDILKLWDGIRETPGRILFISSNHYHKLDPALVRPGRIDITHELSNASYNTISEMYLHLFGNSIDKIKLNNIKENFYSPAELINIYVSSKNEDEFMNRLLQNKKI